MEEMRRSLRAAYHDPNKVTIEAAMTLARRVQKTAVSKNASKAANALHAEDNEIAERIKAWYLDNHHHYRSMDAAAEAVLRLEPIAFRTARKHIGTAAEELRSARKE